MLEIYFSIASSLRFLPSRGLGILDTGLKVVLYIDLITRSYMEVHCNHWEEFSRPWKYA